LGSVCWEDLKKKEADTEKSVKAQNPEAEKSEAEAKTRKPKQKEATGSRYAAMIILIITVVLSLYFYWKGDARGERKSESSNEGRVETSVKGTRFELK
jgi:hypothetical protein